MSATETPEFPRTASLREINSAHFAFAAAGATMPGERRTREAGKVEEAGRVVAARTSASKTAAATTQRRRAAQRNRRTPHASRWPWVLGALELLALLAAALVGVAAVLGRAAGQFAGGDTWHSLVPFAGSVLVLVLAGAALLLGWTRLRRPIAARAWWLPALLALCIAIAAAWFVRQPSFHDELSSLRAVMGGAEAAARATVGAPGLRRLPARRLRRSCCRCWSARGCSSRRCARRRPRSTSTPRCSMGVAATESAFYPRDSRDGGRGLFQLTAPPKVALAMAQKKLRVDELDPLNQRHNAFVAAATLHHYLAAMRGDLFLGLLAYNIGPRNGGLLSIMKQYGARDFVTIQPYLQNLPRDYPIRVLSAALAYRVWRAEGRLPRYEEGDNARRIQQIGIPGLGSGAELHAARDDLSAATPGR